VASVVDRTPYEAGDLEVELRSELRRHAADYEADHSIVSESMRGAPQTTTRRRSHGWVVLVSVATVVVCVGVALGVAGLRRDDGGSAALQPAEGVTINNSNWTHGMVLAAGLNGILRLDDSGCLYLETNVDGVTGRRDIVWTKDTVVRQDADNDVVVVDVGGNVIGEVGHSVSLGGGTEGLRNLDVPLSCRAASGPVFAVEGPQDVVSTQPAA